MDLHVKGTRLNSSHRSVFLLRSLVAGLLLVTGAMAQDASPSASPAAESPAPSPVVPAVQVFEPTDDSEGASATVCNLAVRKWPPVQDPRELTSDDVTISRLVFEPLFNIVAGQIDHDDSPITALKILSDMAQFRDGRTVFQFSDGTKTRPDSVIEINLREGVKFPDGTELDLATIKASIERLNEKERAHLPKDLRVEVQAGRGRQVRILLSRPWGPYVSLLAAPQAAMAKQDSEGRWMGTGRWRFAPPVEKAEHVELVPNPSWRGKTGITTRVKLIRSPGETGLILGLASGEIHGTDAVSPELRRLFEVRRGFATDLRPGLTSLYMMFNTRDRWLRFPRFKQGIIKGLDPAPLGDLFPGACWQGTRGVFPPQLVPANDRAYRFEPDLFEGRNLLRLEGVDRQGLVLRAAYVDGGGGTPLDPAAVETSLNRTFVELDLAGAVAPIGRVAGPAAQAVEPPQIAVMSLTAPWHDAHWLVTRVLAHHGKELELPGLDDMGLLGHLGKAEHLLSMPGRQFFYRELADRVFDQFSFTLLGYTQVGWIHSTKVQADVRPDGSLQL